MMGPMPEIHDASFKLWYDHPRMVEERSGGPCPTNPTQAMTEIAPAGGHGGLNSHRAAIGDPPR